MNLNQLRLTTAAALIVASLAGTAESGDRLFRRKSRPVRETVTTVRARDQVAPSPMLGSFRPTPYVSIGANPLIAGGFGRESSLAVYGPLSAFRPYTAPVPTVVRGYVGIPTVVEGVSVSYPNLPSLSPVVYPTRASNYSALRYQTTPPQLDRATNWIDHN
jgi:hypothetical protein